MMHCYEIIPYERLDFALTRGLGRRHFSTVGSGVTDGGRDARRPPGKLTAKNGPPIGDFINCRI